MLTRYETGLISCRHSLKWSIFRGSSIPYTRCEIPAHHEVRFSYFSRTGLGGGCLMRDFDANPTNMSTFERNRRFVLAVSWVRVRDIRASCIIIGASTKEKKKKRLSLSLKHNSKVTSLNHSSLHSGGRLRWNYHPEVCLRFFATLEYYWRRSNKNM